MFLKILINSKCPKQTRVATCDFYGKDWRIVVVILPFILVQFFSIWLLNQVLYDFIIYENISLTIQQLKYYIENK